jgi:uncharacterized protein with NAD-binding domain and iron-sulfur cluster
MKIIIIGAGIAGLSAATLLSNNPNLEIVIYEKEDIIGGQAASLYTKNCNVEYSWRIFGNSYYNFKYILFDILNLRDNFVILENNCFIDSKNINNASLNWYNQLYQLLKTVKPDNYYKIADIFCMHYDRIMKYYDDVNAYEYSDHNEIFHAICGPFLGMDAKKVSLAGVYKNLCSVMSINTGNTYLTKEPTNDSVFNKWEIFLNKRGVKIYKSVNIQDIHIINNSIKDIIIDGNIVTANEYIFASSLKFVNALFKNKYKSCTFDKMKKIEIDLQLYFTINLYFSKKIKNMECKQFVILDAPWQPIVQRKLNWSKKVLDKCYIHNKKIKEVWNVGFIDYNIGTFNKKILRDCSLQEAIKEGILQIKQNDYIKNLFNKEGVTFDEIFIGYEYWHQFKNNSNGKLISQNPKFSINVNTMKNMPNCYEPDLPKNMTLSGYYVNSTMGGVSMEASCETGLNAAKHILDKYNLVTNSVLPINHTNRCLTYLTYPLILLDKLLFYLDLPSIIKYVNSFYLLLCYFIILLFIFLYLSYKLIHYIYKKNNKFFKFKLFS